MSALHVQGRTWRRQIRKMLLETNPYCVHCGRDLREYDPMDRNTWATIEHLTPLREGGTDALSNLALSCFKHNE